MVIPVFSNLNASLNPSNVFTSHFLLKILKVKSLYCRLLDVVLTVNCKTMQSFTYLFCIEIRVWDAQL